MPTTTGWVFTVWVILNPILPVDFEPSVKDGRGVPAPDIQFHGWRLCSDGARQADSTIAATCSALTVFDGVTSIVMASSVWSLYAPAGN